MSDKPKCPTTVYGDTWSTRGHACGRTGAYEHEGKHYCKMHHPPTVKAKREAKHAKWIAEAQAKRAAEKQLLDRMSEQKRRAECFHDLLEALQLIQGMAVDQRGDDFNLSTEQWAQVHAAIAKATQ